MTKGDFYLFFYFEGSMFKLVKTYRVIKLCSALKYIMGGGGISLNNTYIEVYTHQQPALLAN